MQKFKKLSALIATLLMIVVLTLAVGPIAPVMAAKAPPPALVNYYLYATDGYWTMADGTSIYSYGFIGGRSDKPLRYIDSAGQLTKLVAGVPTPALPTDIDGDLVPPPTSGPYSGADAVLAGNAQFPAPIITCAVGDVVTIKLKNLGVSANLLAPNDPHTIHLHGLDVDAANDGVPETSVAAIPAVDTEGIGLVGTGNIVVYSFTAKTPGTYFYHCHQEADIHVTMGMYGALIVYNPGEAGATTGPGNPGSLFGFKYNKDVVLLMSDTDVRQHLAEEGLTSFVDTAGGRISLDPPDPITLSTFNPVDYKPQYWFLNGLSFPNTIHAATGTFVWADWLAAHPGYDPMITGSVAAQEKVLVRMINMGFETQPMHIHGFHPKVIGKDQRAWDWSAKSMLGAGLEVNTITIGSGEEYDLLIDFSAQAVTSTYDQATESRYDTGTGLPFSNTGLDPPYAPIPDFGDPANPPYIGGPVVSGAVGLTDPATGAFLPTGSVSQIFVFHNHDDYKATNNGV